MLHTAAKKHVDSVPVRKREIGSTSLINLPTVLGVMPGHHCSLLGDRFTSICAFGLSLVLGPNEGSITPGQLSVDAVAAVSISLLDETRCPMTSVRGGCDGLHRRH
jgi:hypothetical protein